MSLFAIGVRSHAFSAMGAIILAVGCSSSTSGPDAGGAGSSSSSSGGAVTSSSSSSGGSSSSSSSGGQSSGGDAGAAGDCDMQSNSECIDYNYGTSVADAMIGCSILHGTYSPTSTCDEPSSAGGCHQVFGNGVIQTTWYYSPITTDAVMGTCMADANATYVAP